MAIGLIAIIAGFIVLIVALETARRTERTGRIQAQAEANRRADTLARAAEAFKHNDLGQLGDILKVAVVQSETDARNASARLAPPDDRSAPPAPIPVPVLTPDEPDRTIAVPKASASYPQRVFIQFAGLIQRSDIIALNQALKKAGWRVEGPSGERTVNAAGLNEVRYSSNDDKAAADELARALTEAGVGKGPVRAQQVSIIVPGILEAWISRT